MNITTGNQNSRGSDPEWIYITACSLSEFVSDMGNEPGAGLLVQAIRDLGISPGCLAEIQTTLSVFANEAMAQCRQSSSQMPVMIRLFCQQMGVEDNFNGGWGYFLIERGVDDPAYALEQSQNLVDLYLYREGE